MRASRSRPGLRARARARARPRRQPGRRRPAHPRGRRRQAGRPGGPAGGPLPGRRARGRGQRRRRLRRRRRAIALCDDLSMFGGGGSIQLARVFGIRIGVPTSWFLVLFFFIFVLSGSFRQPLNSSDTTAYITAVASVLLFFGSLLA